MRTELIYLWINKDTRMFPSRGIQFLTSVFGIVFARNESIKN